MADLQDLAKAFAYGLSKFTLILSIVCFVVALLAMIVLPGFDVEALEVIADKTFRVSFVAIIVSTICMLCLHKSENNDDCY